MSEYSSSKQCNKMMYGSSRSCTRLINSCLSSLKNVNTLCQFASISTSRALSYIKSSKLTARYSWFSAQMRRAPLHLTSRATWPMTFKSSPFLDISHFQLKTSQIKGRSPTLRRKKRLNSEATGRTIYQLGQ